MLTVYRPPQVFGPAWTLFYGLMGYSAYRAYSTGMATTSSLEKRLLTKQGATLYTIQLGLNLLWMPLFFWAKRPIEATVDIVALTGVVSYLTYIWGQVDVISAWALAPYLGWLGFATYLSAGVGYLNDWDTASKEVCIFMFGGGRVLRYIRLTSVANSFLQVDFPPSAKLEDTKFVDEK